MPSTLHAAAIQLDATPVPVPERLERAAARIAEAADAGANLVTLPELFNTGYTYEEILYERTETRNGETLAWLREQAAVQGVHLAGTWLLVDNDDVYNTAFLVAPDGTLWTYRKQYPYLWERTLYRDGRGITVADTALGRIGMLINWDAAHAHLWRRYAAKVDLMLVFNALPDIRHAAFAFPDGTERTMQDLGGAVEWSSRQLCRYLGADLEAQGRWLNVPIVCAGVSGTLDTRLPMPLYSVGTFLAPTPQNWQYLKQEIAAETRLVAPFQRQTKILDSKGGIMAQTTTDSDAVVSAELSLSDVTPLPRTTEQPPIHEPRWAYPAVDAVGAALLTPVYRRGLRRQWGASMAPRDADTVMWLYTLAAVAVVAALLGWWRGKND